VSIIRKLRWWGYLDDRGIITVKPYIHDRIIQNTEQLPFCKGIFDVFEAIDRQDAMRKCHEALRENSHHEKR